MSNTPHELAEEFPEHIARMRDLRQSDAHFAGLFDAYHTINRAVHRAETNVAPTSDDHLTDMRRERMSLKDQVYAYLSRDAAT